MLEQVLSVWDRQKAQEGGTTGTPLAGWALVLPPPALSVNQFQKGTGLLLSVG